MTTFRSERVLAERDHTSLNQFIALAVAEKVAALEAAAFFKARAERSTGADLARILDQVPDVRPLPGDEWPPKG
ncbi:MAG: pilus assembly protein HicB [Lautropia sp.]|nr:pilus assembly protein HicB [Lautropia sp.]